MAIQLDHIIVPSRDKHAAAKRLAELLDVPSAESLGEFVAVFVNDGLTLDFANRERFENHHLCFRVSDAEFDAIFGRIKAARIAYRSRPHGEDDFTINTRMGQEPLLARRRRPSLGNPHRELCAARLTVCDGSR